MDISEIRRLNVKFLIESRFNGNASAFASAVDKQDSQVYRMFNEGKNGRNVSTASARLIENKLMLEVDSMDQPMWGDEVDQEMAKIVSQLKSLPKSDRLKALELFRQTLSANKT